MEAKLRELLTEVNAIGATSDTSFVNQPKEINNVEMRDYQLTGLNWMISRYLQNVNGILGDEMGLGKTLQAISMLVFLHDHKKIQGPFLVVCPLSIVENWKIEIQKFAPHLTPLKYMGDKEARTEIRKNIIDKILEQPKAKQKDPDLDFHVMITTPELLMNDIEFVSQFKWKYVIIDEAHRLKSRDSLLYTTMLEELKTNHYLLLTGTPGENIECATHFVVQNNLKELWALLHFCNPKIFDDEEFFLETFGRVEKMDTDKKKKKESSKDQETVDTLHKILRPFLLRRTKADVDLDLPEKTEVIVFTGMTAMQKKYYKWVLTKNVEALSNARTKTSLMNVIMHLRKCCNHPYLFDGAEPTFDGEFVLGEHLVDNSGKLVVLDKLLSKLKKEKHKVLIFSQMTRMLDIVQDYLHFRNYSYDRLDGSVRGDERFTAIKNFNETDTFVFLLSTRAGGLGLNLTAADTVIFIDSDWNPQRDLQAAARAHRIGQTKEVKIIRLISKDTVEELVLKRAMQKLKLTHQVIETGNFTQPAEDTAADDMDFKPGDLQDMIKYGLKKILASEESTVSDEDIDTILSRAEEIKETQEVQMLDLESQNIAAPENMYVYQGVDYSKDNQAADDEAFKSMVQVHAGELPKELDEKALRKRKLAQVSKEEQEQAKRQKREEKKKNKWIKNDYTSAAIVLQKVEEEEEESRKALESSLDGESEEHEIFYVSGDATKPKFNPQDTTQNAIIVNCIDNSGDWGYGGFFAAISKLSTEPEEKYGLAGEMDDLELGSAHLYLVKKLTGEAQQDSESQSQAAEPSNNNNNNNANNEPKERDVYVANCIVQSRKKKSQQISGILVSELKTALTAVAQEAKRLNASVHLPRIGQGTQGFNWYAIERTIRLCLAAKGIPTYVYYFRRQHGGQKGGTPQRQSQPKSQSQHQSQDPPSTPPIAQLLDESMDEEAESSVKKVGGVDIVNPLPDLFTGCRIQLLNVEKEEPYFRRYIIAFGGIVEKGFTKNTSHIVTGLKAPNMILKSLMTRSPQLKVVSTHWLKDCFDWQKRLPEGPYQLSLTSSQ